MSNQVDREARGDQEDRAVLQLHDRVYQPNQQLQQNVDHHTLGDPAVRAVPEARVVRVAQEDRVDPAGPQLLNPVYQLNQPSLQKNRVLPVVQEVQEDPGDPQAPEAPVDPVVLAGLEAPVDQEGQVWFMFPLILDECFTVKILSACRLEFRKSFD